MPAYFRRNTAETGAVTPIAFKTYQPLGQPASFCELFQLKMVKFNLKFYIKLVKNFILEEKITLRYKTAWKK